jgi:hypothetical protein
LISTPVLITDACVLIDYAKSAKDVLRILTRSVRVVVPRILLVEEVHDLTVDEAVSLGLEIVDAPIEMLDEATRMPRPLSNYDWLCLILARDNSWICVSNDKRLRAECNSIGVDVQWSLDPVLMLVRQNKISKQHAEKTVRAMAKQNRFIGTHVVARFISRIRGVKR